MSQPVSRSDREKCRQPRPEWVSEDDADSFATWILEGATPSGMSRVHPGPGRGRLSVDEMVAGIRRRDTSVLARAITLVESNSPAHQDQAQELVSRILPLTGGAMRLGITGIPGAGKSTLIEALGCSLCERGHRVAVLAIDPSSTVTGGSILGDKMRMERLSRQMGAFIRPSPSGGSLGGVARKSREAMLLCEAAGYDIIMVETVGVGQNEVTVRSMVDCFLMVMIAGAGDEIQGIKKGIMELADFLLINKADGDNRPRALAAKAEMTRVLRYLRPATEGWESKAMLVSAMTNDGIPEMWASVGDFFRQAREGGVLDSRRRSQSVAWMHQLIREALTTRFYQDPGVKSRIHEIENQVADGKTPPLRAAFDLMTSVFKNAGPGEINGRL